MSLDTIHEASQKLAGNKVLIIGDLMLDHYLIGGVERISPEAPVPVVNVQRVKSLLGGAGNVARNITALGGDALLVSTVGDDEDGRILESLCKEAQVRTKLIVSDVRPTTKKTRIIASNQQVVRVDQEMAAPFTEQESTELFKYLQEVIETYPVIILSDYGKGCIAKDFMTRFMALVKSCKHRPLVLVDPKTVNYDLYTGVDLLTPNTKEAGEGAGFVVKERESVERAGQALFDRLQCKNLLITMGPDGMALFNGEAATYQIPTFARNVFDVTGAGDTVIATIGLALASGADLLTACTLANYAAGVVVAQVGAATASPEELAESINELPEPEVTNWKSVTIRSKDKPQ